METNKTIGIIGAMDEEIEQLKNIMNTEITYEQAGLVFFLGKLNNKSIVLVRSGIGKVNAALCTQILVDKFDVNYVINTGVAGAIDGRLNIGDVVISSDTAYHDFDTTAFGYKKGQIPRMKESFFKADESMIQIAKQAGKILKDHKVYVARIVSGDQFVAEDAIKERISTDFNGWCTEMEGTAIAHVCHVNNVPYVIIRSISDKADHSADMNYNDFVLLAAENSSVMIQNIIKNI